MKAINSASRREFLKLVGAGTCGSLVHSALTPAKNMLAFADPSQAIGSQPIFILINLAGGCSLTVTPFYNGTYRDLNPTISYSEAESIPLNAEQGLHPALTALKTVWDENSLALVNMVGYPDADRSHDSSTEIFFRGIRSMTGAYGGWAARLTCQMASTFAGVSLAGANTLVKGDCNPPRALGNLTGFGESTLFSSIHSKWARDTRTNMILQANPSSSDSQTFVRASIQSVEQSIDLVKQYTNVTLPTAFPNTGFGNACRDAAKLVNAPALGTQFIYLQTGGYDTHSNARESANNRLTELNNGLAALIAQIKLSGRWNDTVICTMTEFSRTYENDSQGDDHGHASAVFVAGGAVHGGIKTAAPTTAEFVKNNYIRDYHVDFRQVFTEIITAMSRDPSKIFIEPYAGGGHLGLFG